MKLPVLQGVIRRRLLVNFRVDPAVLQRQMPGRFRPKLQGGHAVAGICLIRLEDLRPQPLPAAIGVATENAAHRVAVTWTEDGAEREGVFIPRRDTESTLTRLVGGRLFPGEHYAARFTVQEEGDALELRMESDDGAVRVEVAGRAGGDWPPGSCFPDVDAASAFFEPGSLGWSVTKDEGRLDGIELVTHGWSVEPFAVERVYSSWFADPARFPPGSVEFDCALLMRDRPHEWHAHPDMRA